MYLLRISFWSKHWASTSDFQCFQVTHANYCDSRMLNSFFLFSGFGTEVIAKVPQYIPMAASFQLKYIELWRTEPRNRGRLAVNDNHNLYSFFFFFLALFILFLRFKKKNLTVHLVTYYASEYSPSRDCASNLYTVISIINKCSKNYFTIVFFFLLHSSFKVMPYYKNKYSQL